MKLTIQERLADLRHEHRLTLEQLAEKTGLSRSALASYESDDFKDISHFALLKLAKFYDVSADYLLGMAETKHPSDVETATLGLSDELIALLRAGKINTPMLSEMASHRGFVKLLADMEIYVDGLAEQQIQILNAAVNVAQDNIIKGYYPDEYESFRYLLNAAEVQEGEYFSRRVHDDIDVIMADMKKTHAQRQGKTEESLAERIKHDIEEAINNADGRFETLLRQTLIRLGVPYAKLTEEEKQTFLNVLLKSKMLQSGIPKRGKHKRKQ